ncbi:odorant receptor 10a [Aethina tumida]|uniref:odorant receptor 10a n=1 Tax=Aethina tumida TaxID=116153 RepID=UPI0021484603|nr:odorant receptor 10a [Aethina tumida]
MTTFCIFLYIIYPLYTNKTQNLVGDNAKFIFSSWFPFNKTEHFTLVYVLHVVAGYYGSAYAVYSDAAFFSIMIYCVGQMKILQHYLSNIYKYSIDYQKINNCNLDEAQICVVKKFIVMHQDIISFVELLDDAVKVFMMIDFIMLSVKMTILIIQFISYPVINVETSRTITHLIATILEISFLYWNGNEVIVQSTTGISSAIFNGDWYLMNEKAKKYVYFMMMRTERPLKISIGPFSAVTLQAALSIIKSIYSYVAVIYKN